jgi:hypothetical protein
MGNVYLPEEMSSQCALIIVANFNVLVPKYVIFHSGLLHNLILGKM